MKFKSPHKEYILPVRSKNENGVLTFHLVHFHDHFYSTSSAHEAQAIRETSEFRTGALQEVKK
jgi:hypothetical protein